MLYAENVLVKALPKLADEASDDKLRAGFEAHLEETKQHVKNVEQAFSKLGEKPSAEKCPAIDGIKAEHDKFMKEEEPSAEICDLFLTCSGARAEHDEIAAYSGLITSAKALASPRSPPCSRRISARRRRPSASSSRSPNGSRRTPRSPLRADARCPPVPRPRGRGTGGGAHPP